MSLFFVVHYGRLLSLFPVFCVYIFCDNTPISCCSILCAQSRTNAVAILMVSLSLSNHPPTMKIWGPFASLGCLVSNLQALILSLLMVHIFRQRNRQLMKIQSPLMTLLPCVGYQLQNIVHQLRFTPIVAGLRVPLLPKVCISFILQFFCLCRLCIFYHGKKASVAKTEKQR